MPSDVELLHWGELQRGRNEVVRDQAGHVWPQLRWQVLGEEHGDEVVGGRQALRTGTGPLVCRRGSFGS